MPGPKAGAKPLPRRSQRETGAVSPRKPTAIDRHVGRRLRLLRQQQGMSLERLAEIVDVAPQQIQKYEIGETRISASRIFQFSQIFDTPLAWFYGDLAASTAEEANRGPTATAQEQLLVGYYTQLAPQMRQGLIEIARTLSEMAANKAK